MNKIRTVERIAGAVCCLIAISFPTRLLAQQPEGPQSDAPPPVAPKPVAPQAGSNEKITVPAGTRRGARLQKGISTRSAKPGGLVLLQTSIPITGGKRIVSTVGCSLRREPP